MISLPQVLPELGWPPLADVIVFDEPELGGSHRSLPVFGVNETVCPELLASVWATWLMIEL